MDMHIAMFREEANELLTELETSLLELEENPADIELIGQVFRALHTIKGSGGMVGLEDMAAFTHEVETVFDLVRAGELAATAELVSLTLAAKDQIRTMLEASSSGKPADSSGELALITALRDLAGAASPPDLPPPVASPAEMRTYRIEFRPAPDIFANGTNPLLLLEELAGLGEGQVTARLEAIPPLDALDPEACYTGWEIWLTTTQDVNAIRDVFIFVEDNCRLTIDEVTDEAPPIAPVLADDFQPAHDDAPAPVESPPPLRPKPEAPPAENDATLAKSTPAQAVSSVRVPADKLDWLVNLVGELVTVQARLSQTVASENIYGLTTIVEEIERLSGELRDVTLNIRMVPIGTTFSKFKRLVHDLSHKLGKEVKLVTSGAETELDKTVIERLNDPLVHLIRNCIDHGIEAPAVRQAAGKPRQGTVHLSAVHAGANVLVRITDDGAGLDPEKIRARAVANGLLGPETEVSELALFALLFMPGFSTAAQISDVSGRGVGLDVVKGAVESLRGSIDITSQSGVGTTITLKLPLTLAIIDGLLVRVGTEHFALPLLAVEECVELTKEDSARTHGRHMADVRGQLVPYIRLRERFNINGARPPIEQIVITEVDNHRVGFVVDQVIGEHQTVIKTLSRVYRKAEEVAGATILGNGTVALILDIAKLVQGVEQAERVLGLR
jgi:two-component system chemotaxis sensor kinase CheA